MVSAVTSRDAALIRDAYSESARKSSPETEAEGLPEAGLFYVIQLEPELDPLRYKVGFTTDLEGRLRHHSCSAPFAAQVKTWRCRRTWERAAIDCVTAGSTQLHTKVFRAIADIADVVKKSDAFFSVMPQLGLPDSSEEAELEEDQETAAFQQ